MDHHFAAIGLKKIFGLNEWLGVFLIGVPVVLYVYGVDSRLQREMTRTWDVYLEALKRRHGMEIQSIHFPHPPLIDAMKGERKSNYEGDRVRWGVDGKKQRPIWGLTFFSASSKASCFWDAASPIKPKAPAMKASKTDVAVAICE